MDELLKTLPEILKFNDVRERPHAFISEDGDLLVSGEYGDGAIDYYGEYRCLLYTLTLPTTPYV